MDNQRQSVTVTAQKMLALLRKNVPKLMAQDIVGVQPMSAGTGRIFMVQPNYYISKYKFSRAKWYEAEFNWQDRNEILAWCTEQFGPRPKVSDAWSRWYDNYHDMIFFRDEKDYVLFMLRWS
jgi:hypothetical protein